MQISITGRHIDVTDAMKVHASEKLENALADFPRVENVHLIMNVEKYRHQAEVVIQAKDHIRIDAKEESDNMYASIDGAIDKAQKQLRKLRDKVQTLKSREKLAELDMSVEAAREVEEL